MSIKFSVVITTFNRPEYLKEALLGIKAQTIQPAEIIIIDDNSTCSYDEVLPLVDEMAASYRRQPVSCGANKARNIGVSLAQGDVVAFLDDDDIWLPNYLEKHSAMYSSGSQAVVCGFKQMGKETVEVINSDTEVTKSSLVRGNTYCGMSGFSAQRTLLKDHPFDESLNNGQDWDIYVRFFELKINFKNIPEAIFLYRFQNEDGIGAKVRKMKPSEIDKRLGSAIKHRDFLGSYWFNKRVSEQLLFSLKHKNEKLAWIKKSVQMAGAVATIMFFVNLFKRKVLKKPMSI